MAVKYLGDDWLSEVQTKLKEEFSSRGKVSTRFAYIFKDCPDSDQKWTMIQLQKGVYVDFTSGNGEPPEHDFALNATYDTFSKITKGDMDGGVAFAKGQMKLTGGNQLAAMKLVGTMNRLTEVLSTVDTEY